MGLLEVDQWRVPLATATRVFRYSLDDDEILTAYHCEQILPGKPDPHLTEVWVHCGKRTKVPELVENAIDDILESNHLSPEKSPCLTLPQEAWDAEALTCRCEHCGGQLQINPFVA